MNDIICRCGHKMVRIGQKNDTFLGRDTKRIEYSCPVCGNVAYLDPEKWNL